MEFKIVKKDKDTQARLGVIFSPRGIIYTPCFFPVATRGVAKTLSSQDLLECEVKGILCNAWHLFLRPKVEIIKHFRGLHNFMGWSGLIITDSGGYQVFSLSTLKEIQDIGVSFQSPIDGEKFFLSPQKVIDIQLDLDADVILPLDECVGYPVSKEYALKSTKRTIRWARISKERFLEKCQDASKSLFCIIQGSVYQDVREFCQEELVKIGFDGYAVGGVSVGEPQNLKYKMFRDSIRYIPQGKIRYLMGIGKPLDLLEAVSLGYDIFDCIIPTRFGRTGTALTWRGKVVIRNAQFSKEDEPLDSNCDCFVCRNYSRGYLRYLFNIEETLAMRLVSFHNVYFYVKFMEAIRESIKQDKFLEFKQRYQNLEF